jgi:hypothetical protein
MTRKIGRPVARVSILEWRGPAIRKDGRSGSRARDRKLIASPAHASSAASSTRPLFSCLSRPLKCSRSRSASKARHSISKGFSGATMAIAARSTRYSRGIVTAMVARPEPADKMAHDDLVCPLPVSPCHHPTCRLALRPFHAQLSRRRRSARGAWSGCLLRNGAAMGFEVWAVVRPRTSPSSCTHAMRGGEEAVKALDRAYGGSSP